jgi:ribosomal protein L40E
MDYRLELTNHVQQLLLPGEVVEKAFVQRRLAFGGSLMNPSSILTTNKRLLIIHSATMGMRKEYEIIPYEQIVDVTHNHGIFSSSVSVHMSGYHKEHDISNKHTEEGEIYGLSNRDADELVEYIGKQIALPGKRRAPAGQQTSAEPESRMGAYVYCAGCGHKNGMDTRYCRNCGAKLYL